MSPATDAPPAPPEATPPARRRGLDRRTIAICVCVALVAALAAGLLASLLTGGDDDPTPKGVLTKANPEVEDLLRTELRTYDGKATTVGDLAAKPLVVNLWSSTCYPCIKEMPAIEQVHQANRDEVAFVGVDVQETDPSDGEALAKRTGITYPVAVDRTGDFLRASEITAMPTTFLIRDGRIVATHTGAFKTAADLQRLIDQKFG